MGSLLRDNDFFHILFSIRIFYQSNSAIIKYTYSNQKIITNQPILFSFKTLFFFQLFFSFIPGARQIESFWRFPLKLFSFSTAFSISRGAIKKEKEHFRTYCSVCAHTPLGAPPAAAAVWRGGTHRPTPPTPITGGGFSGIHKQNASFNRDPES